MCRSCRVLFSLFDSEGVERDGLTLAFGIFRIQRQYVRAASLQTRYVEMRLVALNAGHCDQTVAILGLEQKSLRQPTVIASGTFYLIKRKKKEKMTMDKIRILLRVLPRVPEVTKWFGCQ